MGTWQPPPRLLSSARSQVVAARAAGSFRNSRCSSRGGVAFADFDAERALSCGGTHDFGGNDLFDQFRLAQALQSGRGEDDGVVFSLLEFAQARVDIAAQRMNVEIGADGLELRLAPQAGCADARALRQFLKARIVARAERVARILPFRDGGDFESRRKFGGQVFQRMHGEIDASGGEGFFNFFGENSLRPLVPTMARATSVILSPVVWMISISTSCPRARRSAEMWLACQRASCEPREPMRSLGMEDSRQDIA